MIFYSVVVLISCMGLTAKKNCLYAIFLLQNKIKLPKLILKIDKNENSDYCLIFCKKLWVFSFINYGYCGNLEIH